MAATFPSLTLSDGNKVPILGLGCLENNNDHALVTETVYEAIKLGYRHFDTAWLYKTEAVVGDGIRKAIDEGIVTRSEVFVTTKIWMTNLKREDLLAQAKESNESLGLGYIDLLLIHGTAAFRKNPDFWFIPYKDDGVTVDIDESIDIHQESWPAMEEVVKLGITKSIGVSNYTIKHLEKTLANANIKPVMNQIESNPFYQQGELIAFCQANNIIVTAYCPFGGPPRKPRPGDKEGFNQNQEVNRQSLWQDETIAMIAKKHGKTVSQILLKFHIARGVCVIPKTIQKERLIENSRVFDFELDQGDMDQLLALDSGKTCMPESYRSLLMNA